MTTTVPTTIIVWVHIKDLPTLRFRCAADTMICEVMSLIEEKMGVKVYQQHLRLGDWTGPVVIDGDDDDDDLGRSLGELGLRGNNCNLMLRVKPKRNLETFGGKQVEEEHEEVGSDDPSDVEIIVDRPMEEKKKVSSRQRRDQGTGRRERKRFARRNETEKEQEDLDEMMEEPRWP